MLESAGKTSLFSNAMITTKEKEKNSSSTGIKSVQSSKKAKKYKKLNYNPREISGQLVRASKVRGASEVLCRAKARVGILKRCIGTGQYDLNEVRAAIVHASRMVDCASMKVRHLKEEESEQRRKSKSSGNSVRKLKTEAKRQAQTKMNIKKVRLEQKKAAYKRKVEMEQLQLEQKRRNHRNQEYGKIFEAEMLYIKRQGREQHESRDTGGVLLELSYTASQLSELERNARSLKHQEQQAEQEIAMAEQTVQTQTSSGAVSGGGAVGADPVPDAAVSGGGAALAVPAAAVDVVV